MGGPTFRQGLSQDPSITFNNTSREVLPPSREDVTASPLQKEKEKNIVERRVHAIVYVLSLSLSLSLSLLYYTSRQMV